LVVYQAIVARVNVLPEFFAVRPPRFEMERKDKLLTNHRTSWPDVIGGENAKFFYREALENSFDVLGINILTFFCDDHVFLANRVREKRVPIVRWYGNAGIGEPVGIRHVNDQVIKELQDLRFGEGATNEDGLYPAAESRMHLRKKEATDPQSRALPREQLVH